MTRRVAALTVAAALAGCTDGGGDFAAQASAICKEKRAEIAEVRRPGALILFEGYLDKVLPVMREQRRQVAGVSGADSDEAKSMIAGWDAVLGALEDMRQAARTGSDIGIAIALRLAAAAEKDADDAATELELPACAGFNPITR